MSRDERKAEIIKQFSMLCGRLGEVTFRITELQSIKDNLIKQLTELDNEYKEIDNAIKNSPLVSVNPS